jgi:hypothetical protein
MSRIRTAIVTQNLGVLPASVAAGGCGTVATGLPGNLAVQITAQELFNHTSVLLATVTTLQAYKLPVNPPVGVPFVVYNLAASSTALIFPPASTVAFGGRINELAVDAAFSVAAGKSATFWPQLDGLGINWIGVLSA